MEPIIKDCEFVVVPSEWHEPSPYVVLQSFSYGKPVVAANMGGLSDLVTNNVNGLLFQAGNANNLSEKINSLLHDKESIQEMGTKARNILETKYSPERYYIDTMNIFKRLIKSKQNI